jgi:hypothetical protein
MNTEDRKKRIECHYLEEARRASSIFPAGELVPHEKPDFLLHAPSGTIGIEVTELCLAEERSEGGKLEKVIETAKKRYNLSANNEPVNVSVVFSEDSKSVGFEDLTRSLVEFVSTRRDSKRTNTMEFPEGYCHIGIHPPQDPIEQWQVILAFSGTIAPEAFLASRIAEKNGRVRAYRLTVPTLWLLIVNDQFRGAGEVHVLPWDLARWKFAFDFEKVLLFNREPRGGEVFELQRA